MAGKIVKAPSLKEQVYLYLKQAIINKELDMETVYSEKWVADRLEVSRTPVREAVLQLKQESFLEILPYKGFKIRSLSIEDVQDTFQIRQALAGFCVILISQNHTTHAARDLFASLEECLQAQRKCAANNSPNEFVLEDARFHREVIHFADNKRFISIYDDIRYRFDRITLSVLNEVGRMNTTIEEHQLVYDKMKLGMPWEAFQAMQFHLVETQKIMLRKSS